ncbi:MAG: hypothetical protein NTW32_06895 [Chloroflexi bacterium]|nr:hypothetical protein [Chloroflexota bacterium]
MLIKPRLILIINSILPAITAAVFLMIMPNDGQNAILFGLSRSRIMVASILVLVAIFFIGLFILIIRHPLKAQDWLTENLDKPGRKNFVIACSGFLFFLACVILEMPQKYLAGLWVVEERLHPLVTWVLLVSLQVLIGMIGRQIIINKQLQKFAKDKYIAAISVMAIMVLIWCLVALTGLGVLSANTYWSKIGVPILWPQVLMALAAGLGLELILCRSKKPFLKIILLDIGVVLVVWLAAVILWNNQSFVAGVFNTAPRLPTYEVYPYNDSLLFDVAAQKMLIGQKMAADVLDKPIYISFLAILHFLAGTSYARFYLLQIMCFAFIPVCGYLIGKILYSRPLGLMFAVLLIIKEYNAIALTNYIHVSTSKMILSEMLTALGVLLFTLFMLKWMKSQDATNSNLWIAGGILGLTSLARLNSISILPATILVIGLASNFKWKRWITASIMLTVFVVISAAPWLVRNLVTSGDPFSFITNKTTGVIVNQRYDPIIITDPAVQTTGRPQKNYFVIVQGIVTNYLHNLIGITLMLPPSLELYKLLDLVRLQYWNLNWDGSLLPGGFWVILGVLAITSWGIASAWMRRRAAGLVPLAVILGYNLTTSISLTSGGRYLVPMDWGILLYFSIGLLEIATGIMVLFGWYQNREPTGEAITLSEKGSYFSRIFLFGLAFLFVGAIPVMMENLPSKLYRESASMADFIKINGSHSEFSRAGNENLITFLAENPAMQVLHGKALYPRYYAENKGDGLTFEVDPLIGSAGFDHLSFLLIGGKDNVVVLPADKNLSARIPGADTWVAGCQRGNYFEAMVVVFWQENNVKAYWQDPLKLTCQ